MPRRGSGIIQSNKRKAIQKADKRIGVFRIVPRASFRRLLKKVSYERNDEIKRWANTAIEVIHTATEGYLINLFEEAYEITKFAGRKTLMSKDLALLMRMKGLKEYGNHLFKNLQQ